MIIAAAGSFEIIVDDGARQETYRLDAPHRGLLLPRMVWQDLKAFSPGAVCLVLASDVYSEADYYRKYDDFLAACRAPKQPGP